MSRDTASIALALALPFACAACGGDDPLSHPSSSASQRRHSADIEPAVEARSTPPEEPPARLTRFEGEVVRGRGTVAAGDALEAGDSLAIEGPGRADVDLGDGGRIVLEADTEIRVGDGGPAQIVLVRGIVHALVPPGPVGPRPPLRIATPAASVDLPGSGEVLIIAHASGATWVASLSGLTAIATGEVDGRRRLRTIDLPPARALLIGSRMADPTDAPARLEDARAMGIGALEDAGTLELERATRELTEAARRLDEALLWLETETRRGLELTSQHREAVRVGGTEAAMRLQRALVTHSQQLYALRQVATVRWERLVAEELQLTRVPGARESGLSAARRDRVASLLGL